MYVMTLSEPFKIAQGRNSEGSYNTPFATSEILMNMDME
jgi:hypothetical protein